MLHSVSKPPPIAVDVVFIGPKFSEAVDGPDPCDAVFTLLTEASSLPDPSPAGPLKPGFSPVSASLPVGTIYFNLLLEVSPKSIWGRLPNWLDRHNLAASEFHMTPPLAGKLLSPAPTLSGGPSRSNTYLRPVLDFFKSSVYLEDS